VCTLNAVRVDTGRDGGGKEKGKVKSEKGKMRDEKVEMRK